MAGYSTTPLVQKLGIKEGMQLVLINAPPEFLTTLGKLPLSVSILTTIHKEAEYIHFFTTSRAELEESFFRYKSQLEHEGVFWISWPKGSSGLQTDLNENVIRKVGLENGLVDIKVCSINDIWSGLKFVYRIKDRI